MRWQEVQERFPEEWVVLEATKAHSAEGHRYIEEVVVIDTFADSTEALRRYSELHRLEPGRDDKPRLRRCASLGNRGQGEPDCRGAF